MLCVVEYCIRLQLDPVVQLRVFCSTWPEVIGTYDVSIVSIHGTMGSRTCLAWLYIIEAGNYDTIRVPPPPFVIFTLIVPHPLPRACCTQDSVHLFCSCFAAFKRETPHASDKSIQVGKADAKATLPSDLEALPGPPGHTECAELCEPQTKVWDMLKSCQVLILHPRALKLQEMQP